jgi:SAM-dependent methyltransferase
MDQLRKTHNAAKRSLIRRVLFPEAQVLDVGCGRGGDLHKWKGARLTGIDPDYTAILEAKRRCRECNYDTWAQFLVGDIRDAPIQEYDIICYNFSLQYIFETEQLMRETFGAIVKRLKVGGVLIGIVPDASKLQQLSTKWSDILGNTIERVGSKVVVRLTDGPYYADGPIAEPSCRREDLINHLPLKLESWTDMLPKQSGLISDIYSKFIFRRIV